MQHSTFIRGTKWHTFSDRGKGHYLQMYESYWNKEKTAKDKICVSEGKTIKNMALSQHMVDNYYITKEIENIGFF